MNEKVTKILKETGKGLLELYVLGSTLLVTSTLYQEYVKPVFSPVAVEDVLFVGDQRPFRHYDYENKSVYRQHNRDGHGLVELLDKDNDGVPDFKRTYIPSRFLPMIQTKIDNNPGDWQVQKKWYVDEKFW